MLLRVSSIHEQSIGGRVTYTDRFDQNYEPTREEILEYADFLGINLETEEHLLWIAKESLKAPLPKEWKPCETSDGDIYYFNFKTGESIWDHPCDEYYKNLYQVIKWKPQEEIARLQKESENKFIKMKDQEPTSENEPWPSSAPMKEKQASINSSGSSPKSSPDGSHETVDSDTKIKQNSSPQQKPSKIVVEEVDNFDSVGSGEIISSPKAQSNKSTSSSSSSSSTEDSSEKETTKNYPLSPKSKPGPDASVAESQEGMDSFGSTDTIEAPPKAKILSTTSLASGPQVKFFQPTYSSKLSRAISTESGMEQIEQKPQLIEQKTQTMLIKSAMKASTGVLEVTVKPMKPMFESDSIPDKRQSYPPKSAGKIPDLDSQDKRQSYPPDASNTQKKVNWKATSPPLSTSKEKETPNSDPSHLGSSLKPSKSQGPDSDSKFKVSIQTESKKAEKHRKNELDYEKDSNLARTVLEKDLNKLSIEAFKIIEAEKEIIKTKVEVDFDDSKPILYYPSRDVTENEFLKQALNTFRKTFQKSLQTSFQELQHEFDLKKIQIISEIQEKYANEIHEVKMETQKQGDNKVQAEIASLSKLNESRLKQVRIQAEDDFKLEEEKLKQHFERKREIAKEEVASQQASFNELQRKANDEITHESWVKELSLGEPNDGENLSEILPKMDVNVQNTTSPMRKSKKKAAKSRKSGRKSKTSEISVKWDEVKVESTDSDIQSEESFSRNSQIQKLRERVNREEIYIQKARRFLANQRLEIGDNISSKAENNFSLNGIRGQSHLDTLRYLKSNSEFYHRMANTSDPNCNTKFPADNIGTRKKVLVDTNEWSRDHQESKARLDAHKEFYNRFKIKQRTMMF